MKRYMLLTFDVEEFTLPLDFGEAINVEESLEESYLGLKNVLNILENYNVKSTFFVTEKFAEHYPKTIKKLLNFGEVALHGVNLREVKEEKKRLESIIEKKIAGFRVHKFRKVNFNYLKNLGFHYDSSIHPTIMPWRYNYLDYPTKIFKIGKLFEIPITTIPTLRLPFSFVWFGNLPLIYTKTCIFLSYRKQNFVNMYFHPWEFINLKKHKIPYYTKRYTGEDICEKFKKFLDWISLKKIKFSSIEEFLHLKEKI